MLFGEGDAEQIQKTEEDVAEEIVQPVAAEVVEAVPEPQQNVKCEQQDDDIEVVELIEQPALKKEPVTKREPTIETENLEKPKSVERASKQVVIDRIEMKPEVVTPFDVKQEDQAQLAAARQRQELEQ